MSRTTASEVGRGWVWASVERGLWAGRIDHEFAGLIEQEFGQGYRPTNGAGLALGTFATLDDAKTALEAAHPREPATA